MAKMKKAWISSAIAAAAWIALAPAAYASDGTIAFAGSISNMTCTINDGDGDVAVNMGTVEASAFRGIGSSVETGEFLIQLTDCKATSGGALAEGVQAYFEPGPNVDPNTANLKLTVDNPATGVQITIANYDGSRIDLNKPLSGQMAIVNDEYAVAALPYRARYIATSDTVTPGPANSSVQYTLVYQ